MSFADGQFYNPLYVFLTLVDAEPDVVSLWAVPETIVRELRETDSQTLLYFANLLEDRKKRHMKTELSLGCTWRHGRHVNGL